MFKAQKPKGLYIHSAFSIVLRTKAGDDKKKIKKRNHKTALPNLKISNLIFKF